MWKRILVLCLFMLLMQPLSVRPVLAIFGVGDTVFDASAYERQLANYLIYLEQYSTQLKQYSTEMKQLESDYANLRNLGYQVNLSNLDQMQQVMSASIGISNNFTQMQGQFQELYPDFATYQDKKGVDYAAQSAEWAKKNQQNAYDILSVTTKLKESIAHDQTTMKYLSNRSNSASGTKDLLQVTNQLLVMQTKQLMQLQQLISVSAKADAAYLAERVSGDEAARAASGNLFRDWTEKGNRTIHPNAHFLK